jgi:long-chain acyl-CoA synthetase
MSLYARILGAPAGHSAFRLGPDPLRRISYGDWRGRAEALASILPPPDREHAFLAIRVRNGWELSLGLLAAWMRGLALLPLSPGLSEREKEILYGQCGRPLVEWGSLPSDPGGSFSPAGPGRLALLLPTSGTSATPKVFGFTHEELLVGARLGLALQGEEKSRNVLNLRPAFTSGGSNTLWPAWLAGRELSFATEPYDLPRAEALRAAIVELEPSLVVASPAYLRALCAGERGRICEHGIPLYYGGLRLRSAEHSLLRDLGFLPEMRYGMTECAHVLSALAFPGGLEPEAGLVGHPVPGLEVKEEAGRLSFRSGGFASLHFEGAAASPALQDGFYLSDDLGAVDARGIFLLGREHAPLVVAGFRFSAAEVEACLMESGLLADCAVAPLHDELWQERAGALVVAKEQGEGLERRLREFCRGKLSPYKIPFRFLSVPAIPAMANGKRDLRAVRELLAGEGLWERHFARWKALRARAKAGRRLGGLMSDYNRLLTSAVEKPASFEAPLRAVKGKHSLYQAVWNWNALAYQLYKYHGDFVGARRCLQEGLSLAESLEPARYGAERTAVEAVWLVFLVNHLRLDFREGLREAALDRVAELRKFLAGQAWAPEAFGAAFGRAFQSGAFRFSRHPDLLAFLERKLKDEERRWLR